MKSIRELVAVQHNREQEAVVAEEIYGIDLGKVQLEGGGQPGTGNTVF